MSDARQISGELLARLARFGRVYLLDTVTSTNDYAFSVAERHEPAVVLAQNQTRPRGRFRRHWHADENSLCFSLLLFLGDPEDPQLPQLTQFVGLAVCHAVEQVTGLRAKIRWPNDIIVEDHKVCGILCEQRKEAIVLGIGLNVNQPGFPEELELPEAGSLRMAANREFERLELLDAILTWFFRILDRARNEEVPQLLSEIKARSSILHRRVEIRTLLRRHIGTVVDIDVEGRVVLRTTSGRLTVISAGQARGIQ